MLANRHGLHNNNQKKYLTLKMVYVALCSLDNIYAFCLLLR